MNNTQAKKTTQAVQAVREEVGARWGALQDGGAGYDMTCGGALHPIASEVVKVGVNHACCWVVDVVVGGCWWW